MDLIKEREKFNEEFGVSDFNIFSSTDENINQSLVLKCNWLGWKKRAELEYRNNPETIEIHGLKIIHKLCNFGEEQGMEGCTFSEIVERLFGELEKAKSQVLEGFVLVTKEPTEDVISKMCQSVILGDDENGNPVYLSTSEANEAYLAIIESQEKTHD